MKIFFQSGRSGKSTLKRKRNCRSPTTNTIPFQLDDPKDVPPSFWSLLIVSTVSTPPNTAFQYTKILPPPHPNVVSYKFGTKTTSSRIKLEVTIVIGTWSDLSLTLQIQFWMKSLGNPVSKLMPNEIIIPKYTQEQLLDAKLIDATTCCGSNDFRVERINASRRSSDYWTSGIAWSTSSSGQSFSMGRSLKHHKWKEKDLDCDGGLQYGPQA